MRFPKKFLSVRTVAFSLEHFKGLKKDSCRSAWSRFTRPTTARYVTDRRQFYTDPPATRISMYIVHNLPHCVTECLHMSTYTYWRSLVRACLADISAGFSTHHVSNDLTDISLFNKKISDFTRNISSMSWKNIYWV